MNLFTDFTSRNCEYIILVNFTGILPTSLLYCTVFYSRCVLFTLCSIICGFFLFMCSVIYVLIFTGVSICTLSQKLPTKAMMVIFCMRRSILLNCIMKRSSSVRLSRGFLSFSYCRNAFTSGSVGIKRIRHSTKSTGNVRKSNLRDEYSGKYINRHFYYYCCCWVVVVV